MIHPWITVLVAILYICMLFAVASYGDRVRARNGTTSSRPNIYALSMAVYCTTWTFFGSVGLAATSGWSFLAIYVGPILVVTVGYPVLRRIVSLSKAERITSVADFLASRYGKNSGVAAVGVIIAVIGTIPYIALQLKAIAGSVDTLFIRFSQGFPTGSTPFEDITLLVTVTLAVFAVLFGTRHADATEHQHGLMLAVAMESVIKLIAFLAVGAFVTWIMFDGFGDLASRAFGEQKVINLEFNASEFAVLTFLSLIVFLLLPRQFHVAVVENNSDAELRRARWLFPAYLCLINLFVIPIAIAGTLRFGLSANADDYVLLLPILEGQRALGLLVFIGGLSAGTAMVIVASVALAIMISNDLVLPFMLKSSEQGDAVRKPASMEGRILNIRRTAIFGVLALAFIYYSAADNTAALASIGLVSFAAIAQLAPAFFIGMIWKQANARGAMLGMVGGFFVWAYCLLVPTLLPENSSLLQYGPFGIALLRPQALFGLELSAIANGVIWSLAVNSALFFIGSKSRHSEPLEVVQAARFSGFQDNHADGAFARISSVRMHHLKETLGRYLGPKRANRAFDAYLEERGIKVHPDEPVDGDMLQFSEQLLASAVGTSSSRLVHTLLIQRHEQTGIRNLELLDEASRAIQFNRDMLQTAFDQLEQGITVFDGNFRLASWNRQFRHILKLPDNIGRAGISINQVCETIVANNALSENGWSGERLAKRLQQMRVPWQLELQDTGCVVEIGTSTMPEGGIVVTWHDITQRVEAARALRDANETLEKRVEERTRELEAAKQLADQANASKTRFLAAASHDIAQPLNAARLYSTTLSERMGKTEDAALADNIGKSLGSVEEILGSILAISRLDTASPETRIVDFPLRRITSQLEIEFQPLAKQAGLELKFVHSSKWVHSDPALLRRMLQNLVSNALKFTRDGRVLVGARRRGESVELTVHDTGIGISVEDQKLIFGEFTRLNEMVGEIPGLGLGLSIVDRIANLLGHKVDLASIPGKGTRFSILVEAAEPAEETASVSRLPMRNISNLSGLKVLCVDNEPSILSGMEALLGQWGCIVSCARNLEEAIAVCKQRDTDPQIMLIDYHLDNTTGVALFREIKRHLDHLPLGVLITADRSERVKFEAEEEAMTILNKPIKPASLRALLSRNHHSGVAAE